MIGGLTNVSSRLASIYGANSESLAGALSRIASGKRIQKPSDDFAGYIRANALDNSVKQFQIVKQDLQAAKGLADFAVETGTAIMEDLNKLDELATRYAATSDADEQAVLRLEAEAIQTRMTDLIAQAQWDGTQVYVTAALDTVTLDNSGAYGELEVAMTDVATVASVTITDGGTTAQVEIEAASTYLADAQAIANEIDTFTKLTDVVINSKEATSSLITDIDEVKELANITDLQIRQQASIAMIVQSNMSRMGILALYT